MIESKNISFITGADGGIGSAIALELSKRKNQVIGMCARTYSKGLIDLEKNCRSNGAEVFKYVADLQNEIEISNVCKDFLREVSAIDYVYVNAGISSDNNPSNDLESAKNQIEINYFGSLNTIIQFLPKMIEQSKGTFVISNSISSYVSTQSSGPYSASKAALRAWCDSARLTLANHGIRICDITFGFVDTNMTKDLKHAQKLKIPAEKAARLAIRYAEMGRSRPSIPTGRNSIWLILRIMPTPLRDLLLRLVWKSNFVGSN